jgi:cytochrome c
MKAIAAIALITTALTATPVRAQDVAAGAKVFKVCHICHRIGPGAKNLVGPELNGLDGRHSGTAPGYNYSEGNIKSGIIWNEKTFKKYIRDPQGVIPGTKMAFAGIKNEKEVDDLWAYIKQFGPDGQKK